MFLLEIDIQTRIIFGIAAMVLLFCSFLISFITSQRKKLQYHRNLETLHVEQQKMLKDQNTMLEQKVQKRTAELVQQKEALQKSLEDLRFTQAQLVHREKMASLGELTAGIAHEIQNPLNFVNNFSEINTELLKEINDLLAKEHLTDEGKAHIHNLTLDLGQNLEKINNHGRRADSIVKGMLQHSHGSGGNREHTDINALCTEWLRLSYHGFRARDKSFVATVHSDFEPALGKMNLNPQEISRVFLNLFNNAFYTVSEKNKQIGPPYEPTVWVSTKKMGNRAQVTIKDNGMGIPASVMDKIFHPFFTTKPTGQGTGLGLSLSYDMIKAAGGEIQVESKEGEYTEFRILFPNI